MPRRSMDVLLVRRSADMVLRLSSIEADEPMV